jgi:hypothetical protein
MKIDYDDDDFGGFTVVEGKMNPDNIPYGWEEVSPNRFEPKWPQCRYRRLSIQSIRGKPNLIPFCLLFQKAVIFDNCANCDQHKPPYKYLEMTPELAKALKEGASPDVLEKLGVTPITEIDPVFLPKMPEANPKPRPWVACKHRYEHKGENDCCLKQYCGNSECPKFEKKVRRRICKKCDHRED